MGFRALALGPRPTHTSASAMASRSGAGRATGLLAALHVRGFLDRADLTSRLFRRLPGHLDGLAGPVAVPQSEVT